MWTDSLELVVDISRHQFWIMLLVLRAVNRFQDRSARSSSKSLASQGPAILPAASISPLPTSDSECSCPPGTRGKFRCGCCSTSPAGGVRLGQDWQRQLLVDTICVLALEALDRSSSVLGIVPALIVFTRSTPTYRDNNKKKHAYKTHMQHTFKTC
jgi:hypothetical protein